MASNRAAIARNISFGLYFFLLGVEYAVILPTINGYLITLQGDNSFLGVVLAAFSFAGLVTSPLFGYITDKTRAAKACVVIGNLLEIVGNFMYFVGRSKYVILFGRVVAGLGSGAASSVLGTLSTSTAEERRTSFFAMLLSLRQIGLIIGPGFNAFLYILSFNIGPFVVNEYSSPGLFMALLWGLHTVFFIIVYKDTAPTSELAETQSSVNDPVAEHADTIERNSDRVVFSRAVFQQFLREEVVVILAASFLAMFVQTGIEAAITPMTLMYFDWQGLGNSYLLLGIGALMWVSFAALHFMSKHYADRVLILAGCIGVSIGHAILLSIVLILYFNDAIETPSWFFPVFCVDIFVSVMSLPFLLIPQVSLFSKITSTETQAFNQGVRMTALSIGMILGPLWASPMVTESRLPIMAGVNLCILCILGTMIIGSYKRLLPQPLLEQLDSEEETSESSPLLNEA